MQVSVKRRRITHTSCNSLEDAFDRRGLRDPASIMLGFIGAANWNEALHQREDMSNAKRRASARWSEVHGEMASHNTRLRTLYDHLQELTQANLDWPCFVVAFEYDEEGEEEENLRCDYSHRWLHLIASTLRASVKDSSTADTLIAFLENSMKMVGDIPARLHPVQSRLFTENKFHPGVFRRTFPFFVNIRACFENRPLELRLNDWKQPTNDCLRRHLRANGVHTTSRMNKSDLIRLVLTV